MISIAMATYNGEKYIEAQLASILKQLPEDAEVVLSDDGSTDRTCELALEMARKYNRAESLRIIAGPKQGVIKNFEHVLGACKGDVIFLADQDDVWMDGKIEKMMAEIERGATCVMHDVRVMNEDLTEELMPSFFAYRGTRAGYAANILKNYFMGCAMAITKDVRDTALPIPETVQMHDQWIGLMNEKHHKKTVLIKEPLLLYRRHETNASDFGHHTVPEMIKLRMHLLGLLKNR